MIGKYVTYILTSFTRIVKRSYTYVCVCVYTHTHTHTHRASTERQAVD
jgi:hypothetical protein